jgi:predicted RNase H-related nuclease YkuK (DUF458 family)
MNWKNVSWFDGSGNPCSYEHIISSIITNKKDHEIHVGADSQPLKDATSFAVVICLYKPRCGAFYFVTRSKSSSVRFNIDSITVHADISQNPINKSSKYSNRIQNFIKSMGFKCMIKPDSWAAWVADKHAK